MTEENLWTGGTFGIPTVAQIFCCFPGPTKSFRVHPLMGKKITQCFLFKLRGKTPFCSYNIKGIKEKEMQ